LSASKPTTSQPESRKASSKPESQQASKPTARE